ncbi:acetyl-CoA synthetase-like protein [Trametes punicea]|nr:acetyl-CoA synthetase-like protein [Trametes punicea]
MATASVDNHYLTLLASRFREHADKPVFRPYIGRDDSWDTVTFRDLEQRLAVAKSHWARTLLPVGLKPLDIVGIWLTGHKLSDLINAIAVSALGYTPQFFSAYFEDAALIMELLSHSGGKALVVDSSFAAKLTSADPSVLPHFVALDDTQISQLIRDVKQGGNEGEQLAFVPDAAVRPDDIAALFHSSGTTGGRPKIIPNTYKMLNTVISRKFPSAGLTSQGDGGQQITINTIGSLAHIATFHVFLGCIYAGACLVQSSSLAISPQEFVGMTRACSLNRLVVYATFLSSLIKAAKRDETVKHALQGLQDIYHTGVALPKEDEEWAYEHGLKVINAYSTTETGPLLKVDPPSRVLRPIPASSAVFLPRNTSEDGASGPQLYEVVVPLGADDCPPAEFCEADGYYHTKDLFERVDDGWVYRGRAGDWIKVVSGFCDTKAMEDNVRKACQGLVHDVVVVGSGRAFPCLIVEVESTTDGLTDERRQEVAEEVVKRTAELNQSLFPHERIQDPKRVIVVEKGALPRTREKRNIRRPVAEELFSKQLDEIYSAA